MVTVNRKRMWERQVFLRTDAKMFFERVSADGFSDSDIAAIVEEYAGRLTRRKEVRLCFPHIASPSHIRSLLPPARFGKTY
jgi:hypothetical protein